MQITFKSWVNVSVFYVEKCDNCHKWILCGSLFWHSRFKNMLSVYNISPKYINVYISFFFFIYSYFHISWIICNNRLTTQSLGGGSSSLRRMLMLPLHAPLWAVWGTHTASSWYLGEICSFFCIHKKTKLYVCAHARTHLLTLPTESLPLGQVEVLLD